MRHNPILSYCLALLVFCATQAPAQALRIRVQITEKTGGLITSAFTSAFRNLGDVELVGSGERADIHVRGVVLCLPENCEAAISYAVALRISEPLDTGFLRVALQEADAAARITRKALMENADMLRLYEETHQSWVLNWGRNVYDQAVRELVAEIDTKCLEKKRILNRLYKTDTATREHLRQRLRNEEWMC